MTTTKVRDIRIFDGEDFDLWKMELKACLMKHEIEDILEPGYVPGNNADEKTLLTYRKMCNKALGIIILSLGDTQKRKIKDEKTPLGALKVLEKEYESKSKANRFLLFRKLLVFQWEPGTTLSQHLDALDKMIDRVRAVGKDVDDDTVCGVMINSLPPQYNHIIENFDIMGETITHEKVREVLLQHEQTLRIREGESGLQGLVAHKHTKTPHNATNNVVCSHCKSPKHTAKECWKLHPELAWWYDKDKKKGQASTKKDKEKGKRVKEAFVASHIPLEGSDPNIWLVDSGASCHMCHSRESFVSLRPHSVSVRIGKKGHSVVSEGVGDIDLTLDVDGDKQLITIHDVLYIPDLPINLLSVAILTMKGLKVEFTVRDGCVVYNSKNLIVAVAPNTGNNTYRHAWLVDSGASCHMSNNRNNIVNLRSQKMIIRIGKKGHSIISEGIGEVNLTLDVEGEQQHITIHDVLYIPELPVNLLSVAVLTAKNLRVEFSKKYGCLVYNSNEVVVAVAPNIGNNTYQLQAHGETAAVAVTDTANALQNAPTKGGAPAVGLPQAGSSGTKPPTTSLIKWHNRLGHISTERIKKMASGLVDGVEKLDFSSPIADCKACALGKLKHKPISKQPASRALAP